MKSKKLLAIALLGLSFVCLVACGNKDVLGTTFTFNYAKVKMVDEYYTHSSNVTLYNK